MTKRIPKFFSGPQDAKAPRLPLSSPTATAEGVIKFQLDFTPGPPLDATLVEPLLKWHNKLGQYGWIGRDPERYQGLGFGNLSRRCSGKPGEFIISGSQTGHLSNPDGSAYTLVHKANIRLNRVKATGMVPPSSETLTHAALYQADATINFVFHVHAPALWHIWQALDFLSIPADIPYGSQEMATAAAQLLRHRPLRPIAMLGHQDGLLAVGTGAAQAGNMLLSAERRRLAYPASDPDEAAQ